MPSGRRQGHAVLLENTFKVRLDADTALAGLTGSLFGSVERIGEHEPRTIAGIESGSGAAAGTCAFWKGTGPPASQE